MKAAHFQPECLPGGHQFVKDALRDIGIVGMNVFEIRGHGRQGGIELTGRTGTYQVDMLPKMQLNVILSERNVERTIQTIRQAALTGEPGDGIIFVYPAEDVIRIRTGERGSPDARLTLERGQVAIRESQARVSIRVALRGK